MENRVRKIRRERDISGTTVARLLNITPQYYYEIERGQKRLSAEMAARLAEIFKVSTDYLLGRTDDPWGLNKEDLIRERVLDSEVREVLWKLSDRNGELRPEIQKAIELESRHLRSAHNLEFEFTRDGILQLFKEIVDLDFKEELLDMLRRVESKYPRQRSSVNDEPELNPKEERDIARDLERLLNDLDKNAPLAFYGEELELDEEGKELLRMSLEQSMRLAKQMAKKKFTPNKYKK